MHITNMLVFCLTACYIVTILLLIWGLSRLCKPAKSRYFPHISVIVAARNEKETIAGCLNNLVNQTYPQDHYEIIVVDDHSHDGTGTIITNFSRQHPHVIPVINASPQNGISPKKQAICAGIELASGEWILTTDADCRVPKNWIENTVSALDADTGFVASWLLVDPGSSLLGRIEFLDSLGFVLIGAAAFGLGKPVIANAANMAYRKDIFTAIGGFSGNEHKGSGDDDMLLQKIDASGKYRAVFMPDPANIVRTPASNNLAAFLRQRIRWASKSSGYSWGLVFVLFWVFIYYLAALPAFVLFCAGIISGFGWLLLPAKIVADGLFISIGCKRVKKKFHIMDFLLAEIFQLLYLPLVAVAGLFGTFQWKGRQYHRGTLCK